MQATHTEDVPISIRVKVMSLTAVTPLERLADDDDFSCRTAVRRSLTTVDDGRTNNASSLSLSLSLSLSPSPTLSLSLSPFYSFSVVDVFHPFNGSVDFFLFSYFFFGISTF